MLGALAGAAGTIGAGVVSGWSQRSTARITASAEYARLRDEPRRVVYRDFLEPVHSILNHTMSPLAFTDVSREWFTPEHRAEAQTLFLDISRKRLDVALVGPPEVAVKAFDIYGTVRLTLREISDSLREDRNFEEQIKEARQQACELHRQVDDFINVVSTVFAHDGTGTWESP